MLLLSIEWRTFNIVRNCNKQSLASHPQPLVDFLQIRIQLVSPKYHYTEKGNTKLESFSVQWTKQLTWVRIILLSSPLHKILDNIYNTDKNLQAKTWSRLQKKIQKNLQEASNLRTLHHITSQRTCRRTSKLSSASAIPHKSECYHHNPHVSNCTSLSSSSKLILFLENGNVISNYMRMSPSSILKTYIRKYETIRDGWITQHRCFEREEIIRFSRNMFKTIIFQPETFEALNEDHVQCTKRNIAACDKPLDQHSSSLSLDQLVYKLFVFQAMVVPVQTFWTTRNHFLSVCFETGI